MENGLGSLSLSSLGAMGVGAFTFMHGLVFMYVIRPLREDGNKNEKEIQQLRVDSAKQETTLELHVRNQAEIQQSLGRIDTRLTESIGYSKQHSASINRLEAEMTSIRNLHMNQTRPEGSSE